MKLFLGRLLALVGLAPARRCALQAKRIDELSAAVAAWKAKSNDTAARVKTAETEARHQAKRAEKFKADAERLKQQHVELERVQQQLAAAERELTVAREHLMAVEVKLDILEGAANILDARTRSVVRQRPDETGAPV